MSSNYFSHYSTCMFVGGKIKDVPKEVKFKRKNHGSQTEHRSNGIQNSLVLLISAYWEIKRDFNQSYIYSFRTETHLSYTM